MRYSLLLLLVIASASTVSALAGVGLDDDLQYLPIDTKLIVQQPIEILPNNYQVIFRNGVLYRSLSDFDRSIRDGFACILDFERSDRERVIPAGRELKIVSLNWKELSHSVYESSVSVNLSLESKKGEPSRNLSCRRVNSDGKLTGTHTWQGAKEFTIRDLAQQLDRYIQIALPGGPPEDF